MAALRKKIAQKKAEAEAAAPPAPTPAPRAGSQKSSAPSELSGLAKALADGALYPEGSSEGAPALWRSGGSASTQHVLQLESSSTEYTVVGRFFEAGRFLGKEDFEVTRSGLDVRVCGSKADKESLVAGLDETVRLPPDASAEGMSAEFAEYTLRVRVPRTVDGPLAEIVRGLSLTDALAVGAEMDRYHQTLEVAKASGLPASDGAPAVSGPPADGVPSAAPLTEATVVEEETAEHTPSAPAVALS